MSAVVSNTVPVQTPPSPATHVGSRKRASSQQRRSRTARAARYAILIIFAIGTLTPIYVMLSASLKTTADAGIEGMWALPLRSTCRVWSPRGRGFSRTSSTAF